MTYIITPQDKIRIAEAVRKALANRAAGIRPINVGGGPIFDIDAAKERAELIRDRGF